MMLIALNWEEKREEEGLEDVTTWYSGEEEGEEEGEENVMGLG